MQPTWTQQGYSNIFQQCRCSSADANHKGSNEQIAHGVASPNTAILEGL